MASGDGTTIRHEVRTSDQPSPAVQGPAHALFNTSFE